MQKVAQNEGEVEWDVASVLQKWTFSVANPMIKNGMKKPLEFEDLMKIPTADKSSRLLKDLKYYLRRSKSWFIIPRLMVALIRMTWTYWLLIVTGTMIEGAIRIALPLVLIFLLRALEQDEANTAYGWAAVIAALGIGQAISHHILFFFSMRVGWNWKNACTALIYDSLFQLKGEQLQVLQSGRMVNFISNDVARFEEFAVFATYSWESFLEMTVIVLVLIFVLNVPAAFASFGATLLFVPPVLLFARKFALYRSQTAAGTDQRVRRIGEVLEGIAQVKAYAWEQPFFAMISSFRLMEEASIARSQNLRALNQGLSFCTPPVVSLVTFVVYRATGGDLTIPIVFATISLLQVLRMVVGRLWTRSIETGSEALASCTRIEAFLLHLYPELTEAAGTADIDQSITATHPTTTEQSSSNVSATPTECIMSLTAKQCYYSSLSSHNQTAVLSNINLTITPGRLTMIVGPVGCGKSSLLNSILGELRLSTDGKCMMKDGVTIAYCSQRAWIAAATVKANITLAGTIPTTEEYYNYKQPTQINNELYATAVESCLLVDDLNAWPAYDETEIGERGVSVSGGQKARISLARAVYSNADVFLLDDPLSAVDAHVGQALLNNCLLDTLRANNKAIILVTHQLQHLPRADEIIVLDSHGQQVFAGDYESLLQQKEIAASLLGSNHQREEGQEQSEITSPQRPVSRYNKDFLLNRRSAAALQRTKSEMTRSVDSLVRQPTVSTLAVKAGEQEEAKLQSTAGEEDNLLTQQEAIAEEQRRQIISVEDRQVGSISLSVYWKYLTSGGTARGVFVIILMLCSQAISMITDYWPRFWAVAEFGPQGKNLYPVVFTGLVSACILAGFLRALAFFAFSLRASSTMHARCFWAVLHSPLAFFVSNPSGRILNRFSRDQNMIDELLPVTFFSFLEAAIFCIGGIILVCVSIPWLLLLMPPLIYAFSSLRLRYITSSREIRRWEAVTRSPLYSDFSATLEGLITLRAFNLRQRVSSLFLKQLDENGTAWFSFLMVSRWLGFRLDLETSVILAFVAFFAVLLRNQIQVGLVGFALVYTMSLSGLFQWGVRQSTEVESQMTAVERINAYSELPPEPGYNSNLKNYQTTHRHQQYQVKDMNSNASSTASKGKGGHLELKQLTVRYRPDLDPVLKQITLDIPSGYKVGICGRTGSGKSSTLLALLRLNLVSGGDIILDGQSLLKMDLENARSQVALIPQEPALFSGSVRFNLDPFRRHSDMEIWDALEDAHFAVYLKQQPLGLDSVVEEGGKNFSVGQRQLLSLARAILRRCQVILMDEVTASIDFQTDRLLQQTIRESDALRQATIITVAHRLRTIADYDMIVVIDAGRVAECGSPIQLLQTAGSLYLALAEQSGELSEIQAAAQRVASLALVASA